MGGEGALLLTTQPPFCTHRLLTHPSLHTHTQDLLAALVLSECVYKKLEMPPHQLANTVASFLADFPPDLVHLEALQLSRDDITQK